MQYNKASGRNLLSPHNFGSKGRKSILTENRASSELLQNNKWNQNNQGQKRPPESPPPTPCSKQIWLKHAAQDHVQMRHEHLQGQRHRNLSVHLTPVFDQLNGKNEKC